MPVDQTKTATMHTLYPGGRHRGTMFSAIAPQSFVGHCIQNPSLICRQGMIVKLLECWTSAETGDQRYYSFALMDTEQLQLLRIYGAIEHDIGPRLPLLDVLRHAQRCKAYLDKTGDSL